MGLFAVQNRSRPNVSPYIMGRALVQSEEGVIMGGDLIRNLRVADDIGSLA